MIKMKFVIKEKKDVRRLIWLMKKRPSALIGALGRGYVRTRSGRIHLFRGYCVLIYYPGGPVPPELEWSCPQVMIWWSYLTGWKMRVKEDWETPLSDPERVGEDEVKELLWRDREHVNRILRWAEWGYE